MPNLEIFGRSSSHYTRVTRVFAHELGVEYTLVPIYDMKIADSAAYGANPALKMPTLRREGRVLWGAENICRALSDMVTHRPAIVWPENLHDDAARNAQELVWHGMQTQVQLILGTGVGRLDPENIYFSKARIGFAGALGWLDRYVPAVIDALPPDRLVSLFEVTLHCLIEHMEFRKTIAVSPYTNLIRFSSQFARRPSAIATQYKVDVPPT